MTCPTCGESLADGANFCEACGSQVSAGAAAAAAAAPGPVAGTEDVGPISTPTRRGLGSVAASAPAPAPRVCAECGGAVDADDYCTVCGAKAPSARDHFEETPAAWVAGVCDRGIVHSRNEDAMALYATEGEGARAVLVVCDGVTNSDDSHIASLAAASAARDVLRLPAPRGLGTAESIEAAAVKVLVQAAASAQTAVIAHSDPSSAHPSSCTLAVGTVEGRTVRCAVIGDSRVYWLPDAGEGRQLLPDDSMAQALIEGGMPREQAEHAPQAHAITKWLGADAPDVVPRTATMTVDADGWLLVCSDGLWNYASEPGALRAEVDRAATAEPLALATHLVAFATAAGGHDNITAALARFGPVGDNAGTPTAELPTDDQPTDDQPTTGGDVHG